MTKHTKGPWNYDSFASGYILAENTEGEEVYLFQGVDADEEGMFIDAYEERDANGRLVAAAPELLEALEECAEQLRLFMELHERDEDAPIVYEKAMAAITNVKGE